MIFQRFRSAAELRNHAEALRARAVKAEADSALERSAASAAFAEEREADAQAALTKAALLASEVMLLKQAAEEADAKAIEFEAHEQAAKHRERVNAADKLSKAARDLIAKVGPRIVKDLRAIQEISVEAAFEVRQAELAARGMDADAPEPLGFSIPMVWFHGERQPGRLADAIEEWFRRDG